QDSDMGASARAGRGREPRDVARAVADHRKRLFGERGDDELAGMAFRDAAAGLGVDRLEKEVVLPAVKTVAGRTFAGDARPHDLGKAVDVDRGEAEALLELLAHRLAPRL